MAWGQKHVRLSDIEGLRQNMASLSDKAGRERGMKGDTISRSALIAEIKKWTTDCACIELIENEPAVDAAPEVHGLWEHLDGDEWICTACGHVISTENSLDLPTAKHCEECGAKMDGGEGE